MSGQGYDHELEQGVIAALADTSVLDLAAAKNMLERSGLQQQHFHSPANRALFSVASELILKGQPVDPLSVKAHLSGREGIEAVGGMDKVLGTLFRTSFAMSFDGHVKHLRELALRRSIYTFFSEMAGRVWDGGVSPTALASEAASRLASLGSRTNLVKTMSEVMEDIGLELESVQDSSRPVVLPTGIEALDKAIGGWQSTLVLLGAKPGAGKSATLAATVQFNARRGRKLGVISLEDNPMWLGWRVLAQESGVNQFLMRFTRLSREQRQRTKDGFVKLLDYSGNILVADGSENGMSTDDVVATANDMIINHGAEGILVDHLGEILVDNSKDNYPIMLARCLSRLRGVANRHGVPMVVAAHTKRTEEDGGRHRSPRMEDFANTSGAERRARVAIIAEREPESDDIFYHIVKQTNGRAGYAVKATFHGAAAMVRTIEGMQ
jgi:replicative DNA helicase